MSTTNTAEATAIGRHSAEGEVVFPEMSPVVNDRNSGMEVLRPVPSAVDVVGEYRRDQSQVAGVDVLLRLLLASKRNHGSDRTERLFLVHQ